MCAAGSVGIRDGGPAGACTDREPRGNPKRYISFVRNAGGKEGVYAITFGNRKKTIAKRAGWSFARIVVLYVLFYSTAARRRNGFVFFFFSFVRLFFRVTNPFYSR